MSTVDDISTEDERQVQRACFVCGERPARLYAVTIDGVALNLAPYLCDNHGLSLVLRVGHALGSILREK